MPYVVTHLTPRKRTISLEDILFNIVTERMMRPVTNAEMTGTRTYFYKDISAETLKKLNIPAQIEALEYFFSYYKPLLEELQSPTYNHQLQVKMAKTYGAKNKLKIKEEVEKRGYQYSDLYDTFFVLKKSSKPGKKKWRQIDAPREDLKKALNKLKDMFEAMMDGCVYHTAAFAYVKHRSTRDAVLKHANNKSNWYLKLDFSDFFGSTTLEFVMKMLSMIFPFSEIVKSERGKLALQNCLQFCFLDGGLPQGTPMSPILTNIMMIPIDHKLSNALHNRKERSVQGYEYGYMYTRYADDLLITNRVHFPYWEIEAYVNKALEYFDAPFKLNAEKTRYASNAGANWNLGIMCNQDYQLTIGHKKKKELKAALTNYMLDRKNGTPWDLSDIQVLNGQISHYKSIEKENIEIILDRLSLKFGDIRTALRSDLKKGINAA